jgi:peptidyl-dipeptidase Dcp
VTKHSVVDVNNPLLTDWTGPFGGVPAFHRLDLDALKPALEAGMARQLAEVTAIASNPESATFENTIVALERAGRELARVAAYYEVWSANLSTPAFRAVEEEMAPRLAEFESTILHNAALFARVQVVHSGLGRPPSTSDSNPAAVETLRPDQQRLVQIIYERFARNGATLDEASQARYADIEQQLAALQTRFSNNVLADEEGHVTYLNAAQLDGLPDAFIQAAATVAASHGRDAEYAITNTRSSVDPFLTFSDERPLRERVWRTYYARGDNGDEHDNNAILAEILRLRHARVRLLGYDDYATWRLENLMAKTPQQALDLIGAVWPAALARVEAEVADMQAVADAEGTDIAIEPWDYRYYAEKVRQTTFDLDSNEVKQYLQLDKLRDGMFFVAGALFDFAFSAITDGSVPVFHEDVSVWEVTRRTTGEHVGVWYLDPYARPGKASGAWATTFRSHEAFEMTVGVLGSNNSNFMKPAAGAPTLVSWDDATTLFHEFGHALHYFSSTVDYPSLNGGVRDYIEVQSQLLERWLLTDEVITRFLVHHQTGEAIPDHLVARIRDAATFNQGFATTEYLACAQMDMRFHTTDPTSLDPKTFEREVLAELRMPDQVVMRHRSTHFSHIFSGEGYAAGYYGYMWADVLTADAAEAFAEAPHGFYDAELAQKLVTHIFAVGNAADPADSYRAFRGRDATIDALMRDRGFPVPENET